MFEFIKDHPEFTMLAIGGIVGLFVNSKIDKVRTDILDAMERKYASGDLVALRFQEINRRLDEHLERCHPPPDG